uniref:Uncharacterized protein n=1 Tax=Seriola dumerili TaxID=41447 RepID=A0A3B4VAG9_SERDU
PTFCGCCYSVSNVTKKLRVTAEGLKQSFELVCISVHESATHTSWSMEFKEQLDSPQHYWKINSNKCLTVLWVTTYSAAVQMV